ncbi:DALR anticodon-binding domain-containing 3 isoform X2 [Labeo rohita]|uniref:DALR anticodon-binding domain-containing 3 isoform X2 n=1 Tax=Labeo rohita TaxID=84645 RepID=A0A498NF46_LABRO|nr:DALR anticodon-binding domain-containing 3 isoform X2 [Labeo rohita]
MEEAVPFSIVSTVKALSGALRRDAEHDAEISREREKLWFKESSAKNLRNRDFLSPNTVLTTLYAGGEVPSDVLSGIRSLRGSGVLPMGATEVTAEGLRVCVDRCAAFKGVLCGITPYLRPAAQRQGCVLINCPALHTKQTVPSPDTLALGQLRTVLIADHLGAQLRRQGYTVSFCPALPQDSDIVNFLKTLGIDWPTVPVSWTNEDREEKMKKALETSTYRDREMERGKRRSRGEEIEGEKRGIKEEVRINLKQVLQDENLQGYDPSLGTCTVQREALCHLAQLDSATADFSVSTATALHVTSCQDEFRQQQTAMLWRAAGATAVQRLVICGPVKTPGIQMNAAQYLQLRKAQMKEASEMKYGDQVEGLYPEIPGGTELDFSSLKEEGEWLLLFNYLIPFSELLDQSGQILEHEGGTARVNLRTEQVCRFLVSLSKDFSSYYNRVHVLGGPQVCSVKCAPL